MARRGSPDRPGSRSVIARTPATDPIVWCFRREGRNASFAARNMPRFCTLGEPHSTRAGDWTTSAVTLRCNRACSRPPSPAETHLGSQPTALHPSRRGANRGAEPAANPGRTRRSSPAPSRASTHRSSAERAQTTRDRARGHLRRRQRSFPLTVPHARAARSGQRPAKLVGRLTFRRSRRRACRRGCQRSSRSRSADPRDGWPCR